MQETYKRRLRYAVCRLLLALMLLMGATACSLPVPGRLQSGGAASLGETPTPATEVVVNLPEPTPSPASTPAPESADRGVISLTDGQGALPAADATAAPSAVRMPRFSAPHFSFEPPAGWEVLELEAGTSPAGTPTYLVRQSGDETVFDGLETASAYVYLQVVETGEATSTVACLVAQLDTMASTLAGVESSESPAAPILDGVRGAGQFVEGRNDVVGFRAYLAVVPVSDGKMVRLIFWGDRAEWRVIAPQMAVVLETMRWPGG